MDTTNFLRKMPINKTTNPLELKKTALRFINAKKYDKAVDVLEDTIEIYPNWLSPYIILSDILCELDKIKQAIDVLLKAKEIQPYNLLLRKKIIKLYFKSGDKEAARDLLESTYFLFPNENWTEKTLERLKSPFVTETMAKLYEKQGYIEDAKRLYEKLKMPEES